MEHHVAWSEARRSEQVRTKREGLLVVSLRKYYYYSCTLETRTKREKGKKIIVTEYKTKLDQKYLLVDGGCV